LDDVGDGRGVVRPDADEGVQVGVVAGGVADVLAGPGAVVLVGHAVERLELVPRPLGEAGNALDGVLGAGPADEGDVLAAAGPQPAGALAQLAAAGQVVGADEGEAGVAQVLAVDVGVDGEDLDALLAQLAHLVGDGGVVAVHGGDGNGGD